MADNVASCMHCGCDCDCDCDCRLTNGKEAYPHLEYLWQKPIWKCDECDDTIVGCHPDTTLPLGYAANKETRRARRLLHEKRIDPLWKKAPGDDKSKRAARRKVYRYLAGALGIDSPKCHTAMFNIDRCREAWFALNGMKLPDIEEWCSEQDKAAA